MKTYTKTAMDIGDEDTNKTVHWSTKRCRQAGQGSEGHPSKRPLWARWSCYGGVPPLEVSMVEIVRGYDAPQKDE